MKKSLVVILAIIVLVPIIWVFVNYSQSRSQEKLIANLKELQTQIINQTGTAPRGQYLALVENLPDGVVMTTISGNILEANPAYREMLGYTAEEINKVTYQQITPKKWQAMEAEIVAAAADKKFVCFQKEYIKKDGTVFPIDLTGWIIKDKNGNPIGTGSIVRVIEK